MQNCALTPGEREAAEEIVNIVDNFFQIVRSPIPTLTVESLTDCFAAIIAKHRPNHLYVLFVEVSVQYGTEMPIGAFLSRDEAERASDRIRTRRTFIKPMPLHFLPPLGIVDESLLYARLHDIERELSGEDKQCRI
jgi:hypothetical protein